MGLFLLEITFNIGVNLFNGITICCLLYSVLTVHYKNIYKLKWKSTVSSDSITSVVCYDPIVLRFGYVLFWNDTLKQCHEG